MHESQGRQAASMRFMDSQSFTGAWVVNYAEHPARRADRSYFGSSICKDGYSARHVQTRCAGVYLTYQIGMNQRNLRDKRIKYESRHVTYERAANCS